MFDGRTIAAVIAAGIAGTVANSVIVALLAPVPFFALLFSPGRLIVAILVAALLVPIHARRSGGNTAVIAVVALTVIPSILAKLIFGVDASWLFVLAVNAVYAIAALAVYLWITRKYVTVQ